MKKYFLLSILFISCNAQQKALKAEYNEYEKLFNNNFTYSVILQLKYEKTCDSTYLDQSNLYLLNAVQTYYRQIEVNRQLKKPHPVISITDKALQLKSSILKQLKE